MRKVVTIIGLIILIISGFPLILGLVAPLDRFAGGESSPPDSHNSTIRAWNYNNDCRHRFTAIKKGKNWFPDGILARL